MKTEAEKERIYQAQKRKYEEIINRTKPHQKTKTTFAKERLRTLKNLKEAQEDLLIENLPEEVYTNEYVMDAKKLIDYAIWSLKKLEEKVGKGYGWTLVEDYLPVHNTEVLVSLKEEDELMLAHYDKEQGFMGYDRDLDKNEVKAWCEIPEWYDWENDEEELTEEEEKERARDFWIDLKIDEARGK